MKKIGIYDPYLNILGGAERYVLAIASCLEDSSEIIFYDGSETIQKKAEDKFNIRLNKVRNVKWPKERGVRNKELATLDLLFYVTDGSLFFSRAKKNILIVQSPIHIPEKTVVNQIKLLSWSTIICYSKFVSNSIIKKLDRIPIDLFVPIDHTPSEISPKKNLILSVGRFFPHLHNKKQKEMVELFGRMVSNGLKNVELLLVGSVDPGGEEYLMEVKKAAENLPITIITDVDYKKLQSMYSQAKIYWHAAGYGEDLEMHPEKAEHFGVVTVEAMGHGAVPVVFAGGGQTEIVTNGHDGFIWRNSEELLKYTSELLKNRELRERMAKKAVISARSYTKDLFCERLHEILNDK